MSFFNEYFPFFDCVVRGLLSAYQLWYIFLGITGELMKPQETRLTEMMDKNPAANGTMVEMIKVSKFYP